ncbi:ribosomal protein S18-alanine N-acetyltransferase [Actinotalea sp. AC32]|nr:ribosomal protein S18-alanine N-acetyltransferase [Actinotalea sp. AC32]
MTVRALATADLPRLVELERVLFGASAWTLGMLTEELDAPGRAYAGVDADGVLVGYAGLWFDGDVAQVMTIGVDPVAQRRGIGTALLVWVVQTARDLGASSVLLEVRVDNDPAITLYERHGFEVLGRRRRYYQPEDVDAFTMRLAL